MPYDKNTIDNMLESYIALLESSGFEGLTSGHIVVEDRPNSIILTDTNKPSSGEIILIYVTDESVAVSFDRVPHYLYSYMENETAGTLSER